MYLVVADKKTAKAKIFAFLDFYKNPIDTHISGGCMIFNAAVDADDNYPVIKQKVAAIFRAGQESLTNILKEGIESGEFLPNLDATTFAFKLVVSIEGGIVMCRDTVKPMQSLIKSLKAELDQYVI